jgi:hypothetical protein
MEPFMSIKIFKYTFLAVFLLISQLFAQEKSQDTVIVGAGGYWREHVHRTQPMISEKSAEQAELKTDGNSRKVKFYGRNQRFILEASSPPDKDWMNPAFDDSQWTRTVGPVAGRHEMGLICRRAKFHAADPSKVKKVALEASFYGGIIVYLNGKEVLRAFLPKGDVPADMHADGYPKDAFIVSDGPRKGKLLHSYNDRMRKEQFALRTRKIGPVEIPVSHLRKGTNVLAVEIHRAFYPAECAKLGAGQFPPVGLGQLFLRTYADKEAATFSVIPPPGFHVWNTDVADDVTELDYTPPCEPLRPVRILALRNGIYSGQVVAGSTKEIKGLKVTLKNFACNGKRIPSEAVSIRYGIPGSTMRFHQGHVYGGPTGVSMGVYFKRFKGLVDAVPELIKPSAPGQRLNTKQRESWGIPGKPVPLAVLPIWITVRVSSKTEPGLYKGTLIITAEGEKEVAVPVELTVHDWVLPEIKDYVSCFSVYQSPDTLAAYYKVPLWSDKHWNLIKQSVKLIGEASNHTIIIPLLSKEQTGNEESYMYWIKQEDGSFKYDTSIMDGYIDVFLKYHHKKRINTVCLIVWGNAGVAKGNPYQKEKYDENGLPKETRGTFTVTLLDPATGKKSDMPLPKLASDEYAAFWKSALVKAKERLEKKGLADKLLIGMPSDPGVRPKLVTIFRNILPESGWFVGNHPGCRGYKYGKKWEEIMPALHVERVYTGGLPDPVKKRQFGWQVKQVCLAFNRYGFGPLCLYPKPRVWAFRMLMEADIASNHRGAGRIGADYWYMGLKTGSGGAGTFYARYPGSGVGQTGMAANYAALLAPGPDGPVTSMMFENARESIQNAEAVIALQKAVLNKKLTDDQIKEVWKVLDERIYAMRIYTLGLGKAGWQERDRKLYELISKLKP